jgi:hypothetical protein
MNKKSLIVVHLTATAVATITIGSFLTFSVLAELLGELEFIRFVKLNIVRSLPVLLIAMPALGISGVKLAGKSKNPLVITKLKRMKIIGLNGILLILLALFLFYRIKNHGMDTLFLMAQVVELLLGGINLILIGLNLKAGLELSGKLKKVHPAEQN